MKEFFAVKKNIIALCAIVVIVVMLIWFVFGSMGCLGHSCNNVAQSCNPIGCVADGCVACTNCAFGCSG